MPPPAPASPLKEHRISVLLVDDQAMIGEAVRRMLADQADIQFHYCSDPTAALARAAEIGPTVILQDLVMPEIDGLTLIRFFRANAKTRDIPLIVLSTKEDPQGKAEAFHFGANDYMVKFPDKLEVIARIRYHSRGYISMLERNEAFEALIESQKQLEVRNRFIRDTFGRYLSDEVVSSLLEDPAGLALGGETRKVTIMMTDLRGFTSISERLPPESVVRVLNNFLEEMTEIIVRYNGTIDEFIGDAILAIFGAPVARPDDTERAVACAIEMQLAMKKVNDRNQAHGLPDIEMGIGLNTGEVVVGNIGSPKRAKYGVVGSNVNLTSRIESYTVGGQIIVSQATRDGAGGILEIDSEWQAEPKGVKRPITLYDVVGIGGAWNLRISKPSTPFAPLESPIAIRFTVLEEKDAGGIAQAGSIVALSRNGARIHSTVRPGPLRNLKIEIEEEALADCAIYAKVLSSPAKAGDDFVVRFTGLPEKAAAALAVRNTLGEKS